MDGRPICAHELPFPAPRQPICLYPEGNSFAAPRAAGTDNANPQAYERLRLQALPLLPGVDSLGPGLIRQPG